MIRLAVALLLALPLPMAPAAAEDGVVLEATDLPLDAALGQLARRYGFAFDWPNRPADSPTLNGTYAGSLHAVLDQLLQGLRHGIVGSGDRITRVWVAAGAAPPPAVPVPPLMAAIPAELPGLAASFQAIAAQPQPSPLAARFGLPR